MSGPVTVYLARHGQTILNSLGRIQGWCDSPLTPQGREQAVILGRRLRARGPMLTAAFAADMVRHRETAGLALNAAGSELVPEPDARLREAPFGPWEGGQDADLWSAFAEHFGYADPRALFDGVGVAEYMDLFDRLGEVAGETCLPVETTRQVAERACAALDDIVGRHSASGGEVLVVSSGLTIVCVLRALGFDVAALTSPIGNGSVSVLRHDGSRWNVDAVNQETQVQPSA